MALSTNFTGTPEIKLDCYYLPFQNPRWLRSSDSRLWMPHRLEIWNYIKIWFFLSSFFVFKVLQNQSSHSVNTSLHQAACTSKRVTPQEISSALRKTATTCRPALQVSNQLCAESTLWTLKLKISPNRLWLDYSHDQLWLRHHSSTTLRMHRTSNNNKRTSNNNNNNNNNHNNVSNQQ